MSETLPVQQSSELTNDNKWSSMQMMGKKKTLVGDSSTNGMNTLVTLNDPTQTSSPFSMAQYATSILFDSSLARSSSISSSSSSSSSIATHFHRSGYSHSLYANNNNNNNNNNKNNNNNNANAPLTNLNSSWSTSDTVAIQTNINIHTSTLTTTMTPNDIDNANLSPLHVSTSLLTSSSVSPSKDLALPTFAITHPQHLLTNKITSTNTTTTTTLASVVKNPNSLLLDSIDNHTFIPSDNYLTQSETQPATLQMNEFDDDIIPVDGMIVSSQKSHYITSSLIGVKSTTVRDTHMTMISNGMTNNTNNNNNNRQNSNRSRRQPTSKTWISPFPTSHENLVFFMFRYKVFACPYRRNCPEKVICELYHHEGERRRNPGLGSKFLYSEDACQQVKPVGSLKWLPASRCANGDQCHHSHTILEQMYHPNIYKTSMCMNYTNPSGNRCKWGYYCTHAHGQHDIRPPVNRRPGAGVNANASASVDADAGVGAIAVDANDSNNINNANAIVKTTSIRGNEAKNTLQMASPSSIVKDVSKTSSPLLMSKSFNPFDMWKSDSGKEVLKGDSKDKILLQRQEFVHEVPKNGSVQIEGKKEMEKKSTTDRIIDQSTIATIEEFESIVDTKAMKQRERAYLLCQQQQKQQIHQRTNENSIDSPISYTHYGFPTSGYSHEYHRTDNNEFYSHPTTTLNLHTNRKDLNMNANRNSGTCSLWKNSHEITVSSQLPTTMTTMPTMPTNYRAMEIEKSMMLWPYVDNEPEFLGLLSRPAVQGGGIGLCGDTDMDSDDEFGVTFPVNITLAPLYSIQQEQIKINSIENANKSIELKVDSSLQTNSEKFSEKVPPKQVNLLSGTKKHVCESCGNMPQMAMQLLIPCHHVLCNNCYSKELNCSFCQSNVLRTLVCDYR